MTELVAAAALGTALVSGVFYAFSTFVMRALARLTPRDGIAAMQSINVAVLNPWFFAAFFGVGVLCIAVVIRGLLTGSASVSMFVGAALYLLGCIGVTGVCNVPLNDRLAQADPGTEAAEALWNTYLARWLVWNHVRTAASLAAAVAFVVAR